MSRQAFINKIAPLIIKYQSPLLASIRIAQACLESADGTSELAVKANNLFGIKASAPWTGAKYPKASYEWVNGIKQLHTSYFRQYSTWEDSIKDHAGFTTSTPHRIEFYGKAIAAQTYIGQAGGLTGTYATDPEYGAKLIKIIDEYNLTQYDKKESDKVSKLIQLDIGHGSDTWSSGGGKGVVVKGKVYEEHNFNSIVAKKLKALLEKAGHQVVITYGTQQPNSPEKSLTSRSSFANNNKVDLFVSIHANWVGTFGNSTNGIAVFYDGYISGSQRLINSKRLAQLMMAKFKKQGQSIYTGGMGDRAGSIPSYSGSWTDFHVNRVTTMPSVLAELGFMSGDKDFDKIFGSQQAKYTDDMAKGMSEAILDYFNIEVKSVSTYNPQGLKTVPMKPYVAPKEPFKDFKVGDIVTLAVNIQWADLEKSELMRSNRYDELVGQTDEIVEIRDITHLPNRNHSNYAVKLKKFNSWVLAEYLVEAKENWDKGVVEVPEEQLPEFVNDKNYDVYEFEKGFVAIRKTDENKKSVKPEEPNE